MNAAGVESFEGAGKFLAYAFMVSERLMVQGIAKPRGGTAAGCCAANRDCLSRSSDPVSMYV